MKIQRCVGVVTTPAFAAVVAAAFVAHMVHEVAGASLGARHAGVQAHAPEHQHGIVHAPVTYRQAAQQAQAETPLRRVCRQAQFVQRRAGQREVFGRHAQHRLAAGFGMRQRPGQSGDRGFRQRQDPARVVGQIAAPPGRGAGTSRHSGKRHRTVQQRTGKGPGWQGLGWFGQFHHFHIIERSFCILDITTKPPDRQTKALSHEAGA